MFNRILEILPAVCLATSMAWATESPFIGEWKLDPSKTRMPDEMKVQSQGANKYAFDFGGGAEMIVVDGSDQPGQGGTLLSVKAEAPDTWIVERKQGGRSLLKATWKLSKEGFCTSWKGSAAICYTLVNVDKNKWSVVKGATTVAVWSK